MGDDPDNDFEGVGQDSMFTSFWNNLAAGSLPPNGANFYITDYLWKGATEFKQSESESLVNLDQLGLGLGGVGYTSAAHNNPVATESCILACARHRGLSRVSVLETLL